VIVRVKTEERARAITAACSARGWPCIAGIEPDEPEDITDFEKLMNPVSQARSEKVGRNEPCPCGSGKKYKRCCADDEKHAEQAGFPAGRFRYEPGSYGAPADGYMPSVLCYERAESDAWQDYFCLVNPSAGMHAYPDAAADVAHAHLEAAFACVGDGSVERFAMSLNEAGYVKLSDFRRAADDGARAPT